MNGKYNQLSRYGAIAKGTPFNFGKVFVLVNASNANFNSLADQFPVDPDGVVRLVTSWTAAIAGCISGRGDAIVVDPTFTTAPTATELANLENFGISVYWGGQQNIDGELLTFRAKANLPQTAAGSIFTVTGKLVIYDIVGEVTTVIQNQANNTKLQSVPTVGSTTDMCSVADIANEAVGVNLFITGTLATALQISAGGAFVRQAAPQVVTAGNIKLNCAASNTGQVKWVARWKPLEPGAFLFAA
jgi:hypothetical protein